MFWSCPAPISCNARAILTDLQTHGDSMFSRFSIGREKTLWYYRALAEVFSRRLLGPLSRDLASTIEQTERAASILIEQRSR